MSSPTHPPSPRSPDGVYLHWGFESSLISAHNPFVNTAYEHYTHHAISAGNSPLWTGFFFKAWDQLAGTTGKDGKDCVCARCEAAAGRRSRAAFDKLEKPDYRPLLDGAFWAEAFRGDAGKGA
jgi:lathosterol oxidase